MEDGLYALDDRLSDTSYKDKLVRFVRASREGWKWVRANPDAAADIVLKYDDTGAQTEKHQRRMMGEIAKLLGSKGQLGRLDPADYDRTVNVLLSCESDPVISGKPSGAWTHEIYNKL